MKHRFSFLFLSLFIFFLFTTSNVHADFTNVTYGAMNFTGTQAQNLYIGICIVTNQTINLTGVTVGPGTAGNGIRITTTAGTNLGSTAALVGGVAHNYWQLAAGTTYGVLVNNSASLNVAFNNSPIYNYSRGYFNVTSGCYRTGDSGALTIDTASAWSIANLTFEVNITAPAAPILTLSVNNTRANALVSGFGWNYTTNNASDPNPTSGYCNSGSCFITNATATSINITLFNISGGTYFNTTDLKNNLNSTTGSFTTYAQTYQNYLNLSINNLVNGSNISGFTISYTNTTNSYTLYTSTPNLIIYNVLGTIAWNYTNISGNTYFDKNGSTYTTFNTSLNVTNTTYQAILNVSTKQLFTNNTINTFNVTNGQTANTTPGTTYDLIPANNGTNNINITVTGNYSQNYTCTVNSPLSTVSCNATGIYDDLFTIGGNFSGTSVSNFTINVTNSTLGGLLYNTSTINGSIDFPLLQGYRYFFIFNPQSYSIANASLPANASTNRYNFTTFQMNTVNFTFYDEMNGSNMNGTNITLNMISTIQSSVYSTLNGTIITNIMSPSGYLIQYSATNFVTRTSEITIYNQSFTIMRLPMLQSSASTTVTVTVVDNTGTLLKNATVTTYKYDITTNTYNVNQVFTTNDQGIGVINVQLNTVLYYFTVEYQGAIQLITAQNFIYSNTLQLTVPVTTGGFTKLFDNNNLIGIITNTTPYIYSFLWSDSDNIASKGCLYAYQFTNSNLNLYNYTCASSSGGTVSVTIDGTNNQTYYLYGVVTKNGQDYTLDTVIASFVLPPPTENTTRLWLFVMFMVIVIMVIMFRDNPSMSILAVGIIPLLFSAAHLISFGIGYTIPLFIICVIIAVVVGF